VTLVVEFSVSYMLEEFLSTTFPVFSEAKKHRKRVSLYFSSSKALRRSKMTKAKKTMSKTNDSSSRDLHRLLRYGREDTR